MLILETPRLRLRWFRPADAGFLCRLLNDPGWIANIGDRGVRTRAQAAHWIETRHIAVYGRLGFGFWAVERREDGRLVGMCGLIQRDSLPEADVGYALLPRYRGLGYAREAAAACVEYAHEVLGLAEVWGITGPDNHASAAVLSAIGLRDHGRLRLPGEDRETWLFKAPPRPAGDDHAQVDALARRFLRAFGNRGQAIPTLAALPHYFAPGAVIHIANAAGDVVATDMHGFAAPWAQLLTSGRLADHAIRETEDRTDLAGTVAHRWLRFEARGRLDGAALAVCGTQSMQCTRTPRGWKIAALASQEEAPARAGRHG